MNRQVLYQTAAQLGIGFSDAEVNQRLVESSAYQIAGEFSEAVYRQQLQLMGFAPVQFIQEVQQGLGSELNPAQHTWLQGLWLWLRTGKPDPRQ